MQGIPSGQSNLTPLLEDIERVAEQGSLAPDQEIPENPGTRKRDYSQITEPDKSSEKIKQARLESRIPEGSIPPTKPLSVTSPLVSSIPLTAIPSQKPKSKEATPPLPVVSKQLSISRPSVSSLFLPLTAAPSLILKPMEASPPVSAATKIPARPSALLSPKSSNPKGPIVRQRADDSGDNVAKIHFSNGNSYEGELVNGQPHGKGIMKYANGDIYYGDWVNGVRHGKGIKKYASGGYYKGDWINDQKHGKGTMKFPNDDFYEGNWVNGTAHGKGTMKRANGESYYGQFVQGKKDGRGTMNYANGESYEGEFVNNLRQGNGTLTRPAKAPLKGIWANDTFVRPY